jgi:hypothetical protein
MALRIRRGLSADRTTITPEQGEFLYTTDTYQVYMGDGTTVGGRPLYTLTSLGAIGLTDLSALSPLSYNNTTGAFSIQVATGSQDGYLSSGNWTTFNNKQNAIEIFDETTSIVTNPSQIKFVGTPVTATVAGSVVTVTISGTGGGGGGVTGVSVATANGFSGVSDLNATNPTLTLATTVTGLLKGNGTAVSAATAGTDYQAALSGTGLVNSSGGTISYITNNSSNWDTAYSQRLSSLTTTGNSGAATLIANVLNIPNYTAAGIGAIASSRIIATTTPLQGGGDLTADRTLSILQATTSQSGFLTSSDWNTFNGKQAALSGTGIVKSTAGTITYLTDNSANWDTAFGWGNHASAGYLTTATAATTYVPQTRSLTIDGVTQNLSLDRTFTINKSINDLTDVTISSVAGGDILQYNGVLTQWVNTPLSAITSVGADNGLSFSGGNVILGGSLDFDTTINTFNSSQYSLTFTAGSTAFSSPGTAPLRITETTAYSAGRSAFYVGANDNHALSAEGKGAPVTTAPTYLTRRSSANLSKNATIHSKAKQGLPLYAYSDSDEAYSSITRYSTPSAPGILIEKTTGLTNFTTANALNLTTGDTFGANQLYNLLTLRLTRSATTSGLIDNTGLEFSFEAQNYSTSSIERLANFKVYKAQGSSNNSTLAISTRTSTINDEYDGIVLSGNGVITLPGYKPTYSDLFRSLLSPVITSGLITSVVVVYGDAIRPLIKYGDSVSIQANSLTGTGATFSPTLGYSLKRIRITNPGSGYVSPPTVTIAPPVGGGTPPPVGTGWATGATAVGTATLTASGEVEYIRLTNQGTRYVTLPSVTISAPPSGTTATAVAEFGNGEVLFVAVLTQGSGYVTATTKIVVQTQSYNGAVPAAFLGVDGNGTLQLSTVSADYLLNGGQTAGPFGDGNQFYNNTTLSFAQKSFGIGGVNNFSINSAASGATIADDGRIDLSSLDGGNRLYRYMRPKAATSSYFGDEFIGFVDDYLAASYISVFYHGAINTSGAGTLDAGSIYNYSGTNPSATKLVSLYLSTSTDGAEAIGINTGVKASLYLQHLGDTQSINLSKKHFDVDLSTNTYGTAGDASVSSIIASNLSAANYTTNYDVEIGGETKITSSGYYEDNSGVDTGSYTAEIASSATSEGGLYRGIDLVATSNFPGLLGTSRIKINSQRVYIRPQNIGTINQVLKIANATTGEVGYTTLSTVATSGAYADLTGTPTIPTTLDSLTNVNVPSPTNGQVLAYNTGASEWQAQTFSASGLTLRTNTVANPTQNILDLKEGTGIDIVDDGLGGVTISSTGGSGGVGLDSVFMLMGA